MDLERGGSEGKFDSSVLPSLETQSHFHQVESPPESFEPKASSEGELGSGRFLALELVRGKTEAA